MPGVGSCLNAGRGKSHALSKSGSSSKSMQTLLDVAVGTERQQQVRQALENPWFESAMALLILMNLVLIVVETDTTARDDRVPVWVVVWSWLILLTFTAELSLRLYADEWAFFSETWNKLEFCIIVFDLCFSFLALMFESIFPIALLRVLRLGKVARASRVLMLCPELRLMLAAFAGCIRAIFWGTVLIGATMVLCSIIAVQFIHPLVQELDKTGIFGDCERCGRAFASVSASALTITQQVLAGDSWGLVTIPVIEHYPVSALFFGGVFLLIGMTLLNLILGIVVDLAQEIRREVSTNMIVQKEILRKESEHNLLTLFSSLDQDQNMELTKEELFHGFETNDLFNESLKALDIGKDDMEIIWHFLDVDKSGVVNYNEFATELYLLKSSDTQFMIAYIKHYITFIKDALLSEMKHVEEIVLHADEVLHHMMEEPASARNFSALQQSPPTGATPAKVEKPKNTATSPGQPKTGPKVKHPKSKKPKENGKKLEPLELGEASLASSDGDLLASLASSEGATPTPEKMSLIGNPAKQAASQNGVSTARVGAVT